MTNIPYTVEVITEYKLTTADGRFSARASTEEESLDELRKIVDIMSLAKKEINDRPLF